MYEKRYLLLLNSIHNSIIANYTKKNIASHQYSKQYEIKPIGLKYKVNWYQSGFYSAELYIDGRHNLAKCYKGLIPSSYDSHWIIFEIYMRTPVDFRIDDTKNLYLMTINKEADMPLDAINSRVFTRLSIDNVDTEENTWYKWLSLEYQSNSINEQIAETLENVLKYIEDL